jgi:hypothetical protein
MKMNPTDYCSLAKYTELQLFKKGLQKFYTPSFIWCYRVPPQVKLFGWLLVKRQNSMQTEPLSYASCPLCLSADESVDHVVACCPFAEASGTKIEANCRSQQSLVVLPI